MSRNPVFVVNHRRTGVSALNVVTAALDVDPRTAETEIVFATNRAELVAGLRAAAATGARVVCGWSFYSTDFATMTAELAAVRNETSGLGVLHLAGGSHASAEPEQTLAAGFDLVASGEGETTIVEVFAALREGRDPRSVRGIGHLANGKFVSSGSGERRELDAFPAFNARHHRLNAIEITRGCIYACSFCQTPFLFKARFRHRSVENVREHIEIARQNAAKYVRFVSPTAFSYGSPDSSVNLDAIERLLRTVREGMGPDAEVFFGTFPSEVRPEHVTDDVLEILLRYVDNRSLVIGGQSGSDRVLEATHRGHDAGAVERAVRIAVRHGFRPDVDFLFGLPEEQAEDRAASVALAEKLVSLGARIHNHSFLPLPGTPLKDEAPEKLEPSVVRSLSVLQAKGDLYGTWREQLVRGEELVKQRGAARVERARMRSKN